MAPIEPSEPAAAKHEKKSKKEKSKSDKKRAREEDVSVDGERRHKKSKSVVSAEAKPEIDDAELKAEKKKKKKEKKEKHAENGVEDVSEVGAEAKADKKKKHKKKHHSHDDAAATEEPETAAVEAGEKKKKHKKKKDHHESESQVEEPSAPEPQPDAMDVDMPPPPKPSKSKTHHPPDMPADPQFPFFTQTVSLYEPLYPVGWAQPVTSAEYQHLRHLQNKYVPSLRGVLMDYKNVTLGEQPGRTGAATTDEESAKLLSKDEYAVGFGWITADVDLFVPSRGAWMEGSVNLQTEGHIGVVCFGKFNASIEARRLPPAWKWVPNEAPEAQGFEETASVITADDHGVVRQIHSTGFWVDGDGERVRGRVRFRIRNFDVGTSGETSYLSLEGTMLDRAGEKALVAEEAETARARKGKPGKRARRPERRRIPEFAMTRFAADAEEQVVENEEEKRAVLAVDEESE